MSNALNEFFFLQPLLIENQNDGNNDYLNDVSRKDEHGGVEVEVVADFPLSCRTNVYHGHQYHYEESSIDKDKNAIEEYAI